MNNALFSKSEIVARLLEIHAAREALGVEESELLTRLQKPKGDIVKPVPLIFGKNIITWEGGTALYIKGKGHKFLKALYEADKMRLKEATLDKIVWDGNVKHRNFREFVRRLVERLEKAKFPYRLLPVESKPKVESTEKTRIGKPSLHFVPSEIIGVKLHAAVNCEKVAGK